MQFGKFFDSLLERINYKKRKTPDTESTPLIREDLDFKYSGNTKKPLEWGDSGYGLNTISNGNKLTNEQIYIEAVALLKFCFPLLVTFLLGHGMRLVDVWFLGKIGSEAMAVVGLGNLYTTISGMSLGAGMLTAVETLVSQAYTGATNPRTVGIIFQRALVVMYLFAIPVVVLWSNAEGILVYMGQEPDLARMTQEYIRLYTPMVFMSFFVVGMRKFLQGLGQMHITLYIIMIVFPINLLANYVFLMHFKMGYRGAVFHSLVFEGSLAILYIIFILRVPNVRQYWPGFSLECFHSWGEYLKLGIPGMLSVSTDWAFEVCAIVTGVLGKMSIAGQSVVLAVNAFLLMIPSSITTSSLVRIGHHLGANRPESAKLAVVIATSFGFIAVVMNASFMYFFKERIAMHFTTDFAVIEVIEELMGIASICHLVTGFGMVLSGTLNAIGRQSTVASFNLFSYYVVGLPFGLYMAKYHDWGLIGVWSGVAVAGLVKTFGEALVITLGINWEKECIKAEKRIDNQELI